MRCFGVIVISLDVCGFREGAGSRAFGYLKLILLNLIFYDEEEEILFLCYQD